MDGTGTGFEYVCFDKNSNGQAFLPTPPTSPSTNQPDPLERPMFIYMQAGGLCDDFTTCDCQNQGNGCTTANSLIVTDHYDRSYGCDGQAYGQCTANFDSQSYTLGDVGEEAAFNGPTAAFNNSSVNPDGSTSGVPWNMVLIPYCTGDVHSGDAVKVYSSGNATIHAHHRGYRNFANDLAVLKAMFPTPTRVSLWGTSAGAFGVACNIGQLAANWPDAGMSSLSNAWIPYDSVATPGVTPAGRAWGAWRPAEDGSVVGVTCPIAFPPGTPKAWSELALLYYDHLSLGRVRKAWTDDYSDSTLDGLTCYWGATPDANGSCATTSAALLLQGLSYIQDDPAFHAYFHTGTCHGMRECDITQGFCFDSTTDISFDYDDMIQAPAASQAYNENCTAGSGQTCFRDWVRGWGQVPGFSWGNVK